MRALNRNGTASTELPLEAGDELTRPIGLSSARWQVLGVVEHGPSHVAHVARTMGLSRQSVQQTADALEKDGFIIYLENPHHHRAKLMQVTPLGALAARTRARQATWANKIGGNHDSESLQTAAQMLREVRESLEQPTPSAEENT